MQSKHGLEADGDSNLEVTFPMKAGYDSVFHRSKKCSPSRQCVASKEEWILVHSLGSGSYGDVHLYKNENTSEYIAVKRFKGKLQHQKSCDRWMKEVKILKTLDHPNIVKAFDIPEQLKDPTSHHPLLATEYCEGGNLRKVIGQTSHLSGLSQTDVCNILSQIADGLMYLHEKEIIHRDLKPENIVLKPTGNEIIYKIIDLGFAKDLGNETASSSFAGTHVYADPYLFNKLQYDKAVDYWSMGVLCFELITGRRPFVPVEHQPPVPFYNCMNKRPSNCVCMVQTVNGKYEFSGTIPRGNSLSRDAAKLFEIWLRNMFLCDRSKRKLIVLDDGSSVHWFHYLKEVTKIKEFKVFSMKTNKMLTYRSSHKMATIGILQEHLAKEDEGNIPVGSQLLLLPDGQVAPPTGAPSSWKMDSASANMDFPDYFLFDKSVRPGASSSVSDTSMLPPQAKAIAENPSTIVEGKKILRCIWAELLFVCKTEAKKAAWAQEGSNVLKKYFEKEIREVAYSTRRMAAVNANLTGMCDMFQKSVTEDLKSYEVQADCGIHSDQMVSTWTDSKEKLHDIPADLKQRIANIVTCKRDLGGGYEFLRKTSTQMTPHDQLQRCKRKSVELYVKAAEEWKSQKNDIPVKCSNWSDIVTCMEQSIRERQAVGKEIAGIVDNILQIFRKSDPAALKIEINHVIALLEEHKEKLVKAQQERQNNLWSSVGYLVEQCKALKHESVQRGLLSIETPASELSTLTSPGLESTSRTFSVTSPESLRTLEDSLSTREEFTEAVDRYNAESSDRLKELEDLDWEFKEPT